MTIDVGNPEERREDLVAAFKLLLDPEWSAFESMQEALQALYADIFGSPLIVADAAFSPVAANRFREVWFSGICAVTLPDDPDLPLGFAVPFRRLAGAVTISPAAGATQDPPVAAIQRVGRTAIATVVGNAGGHVAWVVEGDI